MKIAIDITPLSDTRLLSHKVRGTGFYLEHLKKALLTYCPEYSYTFFNQQKKIKEKVDVVHYPYFEPFFLTLPLRKIAPTVVTVHDLTPLVFPEHFPSGKKGKLKWLLQKRALQRAEQIITDSECSKKDIMRLTGISAIKIHVVYLAAGEIYKKKKVSMEEKALLQEKYNLPEKFVLYVGDATWNKNLPRLIHAIKMSDIPLVMVGKTLKETHVDRTNPWNKDLVTVQALALTDPQIHLPGFVETGELVSIYNLATALIMPSVYEGFGLPVLEAMQCGTPVITTKEGSLKEIAGDAGFYVDAYDAESLAEGIREVFNSPELQNELARKGFTQAAKFSWQKTAQQTVLVYEKAR